MTEKKLTESESLEIITTMISRAQNNYQRGGSFYFLMWGWLISLANLAFYYLADFTTYEHPYLVWLLTFPGAVISVIYGARQSKKATVQTHLDKMNKHVWIAIGTGIIIILVFMARLDFNQNAVILLFAGIGTYITGQLLKFKPLVAGGIVLGLAAVVAFNVTINEQYLVGGIGIILGYLVPGYMLQSKEK